MKKLLLNVAIAIVCAVPLNKIYGQNSQSGSGNDPVNLTEPCGNDLLRQEALKRDPSLGIRIQEEENAIKSSIGNGFNRSANAQFKIPVVVHVLHNGETVGTGTNISDSQIQSQIDKLNSAFDNTNGGTNSVSTNITFCLAENGPDGSTVTWDGMPGVNRLQSVETHAGLTPGDQNDILNEISWPNDQYLNIWIVTTINNSPTGVVGYSPQPLSNDPLDGIVIQANVFGDNSGGGSFNLLGNYDLGMSLVHEAGHYLGLYHTFQGGSCTETDCANEGDKICDTPPTTSGSSCTNAVCPGAQIENYMDYTADACKNTYTQGQTNWMQATINNMRTNLVSPENLTLTGVPCAPPGLLANFSQNASQICQGSCVTFTATTSGNTATGYDWEFENGTPSTATGPGPHSICFNSTGDFNVSLETTDGTNNLSKVKPNAVYVSDCSSGITGPQAQWYFPRQGAVDFSSGVPVGITGSLNTRNEGAASVADASGNLIFYTDGLNAWNSGGLIEDSLRTTSDFESPAQSSVIIPDPGNANNFYVFTTPGVESTLSEGIRYSLYEGATQNFPTVLNQAPTVNQTVTEHLTAVPHCNGTDYWAIFHGAQDGFFNKFLAYQVSASGVSNTPIVSNAFLVPPTPTVSGAGAWVGQLDVAPNGKLLAATNRVSDSVFIYELDRATGVIEAISSFPLESAYGLSFSPNSDFLYVTEGTNIRQYKVSDILTCANGATPDFKSIATTTTTFQAILRSLQIGPDGKIYITRRNTGWLDVINYPNNEITVSSPNAIGLNEMAVSLPGANPSRITLPNMIDVPSGLSNANFEYCASNCGEVEFQNVSCGNQFAWDFGDGNTSNIENPSHIYAAPGNYTVTFTTTTTLANSSTTTSTITKQVDVTLPGSTAISGPLQVVCPTPTGNLIQYTPSPLNPNYNYEWFVTGGTLSSSNTDDVALVDWSATPGSIKVIVTDPNTGCTDSVEVNIGCATCDVQSNFDVNLSSCNATFTNSTTVSSPFVVSSYSWDFGDGNTSNDESPNHTYGATGNYDVTLIVTAEFNGATCVDTFTRSISTNCEIPCEVTADFDFNANFETVNFTNTTVVDTNIWFVNLNWDFGDGNTSNSQNPQHTYAAAGVYTACLTVTIYNNQGDSCDSQICKNVEVTSSATPCEVTANFNFNPIFETVDFTNTTVVDSGLTVASIVWDFGDGNTSTNQNPQHTFPVAGTYTTCLTVTLFNADGDTCQNTICKEVVVRSSATPCEVTANFNFNPIFETVDFTNTTVVDSGLTVASIVWDFGDGNTSTNQNPQHTFPVAGTYTTCLTVTLFNADGDTCQNTICKEVVVRSSATPCEVTANFNFNPIFETVDFTNTTVVDSGLTVASIVWDFGDGNTSTNQNPQHTFPVAGTYTTCLTVTLFNADGDTCQNTICKEVVVRSSATPCEVTANFNFNPIFETVDFTNTTVVDSGLTVASIVWDFGDGNTSTNQNPQHTFPVAGTYTTCLTVTLFNADGDTCQNTICKEVVVRSSATPCEVTASFNSNVNFGEVDFTNTTVIDSGLTQASVEWDFGDGNTSTDQNPQHSYTASGTYNVCLTVTLFNADGDTCENQICEELDIVIKVTPCEVTSSFTCSKDYGTVTFNNTTVVNPGLTVTSVEWNFGDGNTSNDYSPVHTYASSGYYLVYLTMTLENEAGETCKNHVCYWIKVTCKVVPCSANPQFSYATSACAVAFTNNSTVEPGVSITGYRWNFGDGTYSNKKNPTHKFPRSGYYNVCLKVYASNGFESCSRYICKRIYVSDCQSCVVADYAVRKFDYSLFRFYDRSSSNSEMYPIAWKWEFGDGTTSNRRNPYHRFRYPGTYIVCLTVKGRGPDYVCYSEKKCYSVRVGSYYGREVTEEQEIDTWPNPSNGVFNLDIGATELSKGDIKVFNFTGQEVPFDVNMHNDILKIHLLTDKPGVYFFTMIKDGVLIKSKLVKQ